MSISGTSRKSVNLTVPSTDDWALAECYARENRLEDWLWIQKAAHDRDACGRTYGFEGPS